MKISILTVGKIKEKYLRDAIAPDNASETVEDAIRNK